MSPESIGDVAARHAEEGNPADTVFAGAPSGAGEGWHDESASGTDMGNAAAIAGYKDGGARGATPDVEGFASGATGSKDEVGSTSGNGAGNASTMMDGADPSRTIDQSAVPGGTDVGGEGTTGDEVRQY